MASSYSSILRLEKQGTGENAATWGTILNSAVIDLLDSAIAGMATVAVTGGAYSLTTVNGAADEARMAILKFTGILASASTVTIPDKAKIYVVWNATSGAYALTLKPSGTGAVVTQGSKAIVICDGTNAYAVYDPAVLGAIAATTGAFSGTLSPAGLVDISGAGAGQIKFPATQNASSNANTLDDYEEGTWTPGLTFGGGNTGITYNTQAGDYTKIGNLVAASFRMLLTSKGSSNGAALVTSLPFAVGTTVGLQPVCSMVFGVVTRDTGGDFVAITYASATTIILMTHAYTGALATITDANFSNTSDISGTLIYDIT